METDDDLIQRCRTDDAASRSLMDRYRVRIYSFLARLVGPTLADDMLQEFWLKVINSSGGYQPQGKAAGWLFRVANSVAMDGLERDKRTRDHADVSEFTDSLPDSAPTSETLLERDELRRRLLGALERLPLEQRQVFLMREYGKMPFREVADVLGIPLGTALSRMNYALEKLRRELGDLDG